MKARTAILRLGAPLRQGDSGKRDFPGRAAHRRKRLGSAEGGKRTQSIGLAKGKTIGNNDYYDGETNSGYRSLIENSILSQFVAASEFTGGKLSSTLERSSVK